MKKVKARILDDSQQTSSKMDSLEDSILYGNYTKGKIMYLWRDEKTCEHYERCSRAKDCTGYVYYIDIKKEHPLCGYVAEELREVKVSKIERIVLAKAYIFEKILGGKRK